MAQETIDLSAGYVKAPVIGTEIDLSAGYTDKPKQPLQLATATNPPQSNPRTPDIMGMPPGNPPPEPESEEPWPNWFQKGLEIANRWAVEPFNKAAATVGQAGKDLFQTPGQLLTAAEDIQSGTQHARNMQYGFAPPIPQLPQEEEASKRHPYLQGITGGLGELVGSALGDPRNWPFFGSASVRPLLQRLISGGFGIMMTKDAVNSGQQLIDNWDKLSPEERTEGLTKLGGGSVMATLSSAHALFGEGKIASLTPEERAYIAKTIRDNHYDLIKEEPHDKLKFSEVPPGVTESEILASRRHFPATWDQGLAFTAAPESGGEAIRDDTGASRGEGGPSPDANRSAIESSNRREAFQGAEGAEGEPEDERLRRLGPNSREAIPPTPEELEESQRRADYKAAEEALIARGTISDIPTSTREIETLLPAFNKVIGGGEEEGALRTQTESAPPKEDEPPPPVISRLVDDDLAEGGVNVVRRGKDISIISRILGSFNETARKLDAEGHPLGPTLRGMASLISDVTKAIASNQMDTVKSFINGAQKLVSRDEWSNQVVPLMDRQVAERPVGTPDNIWNAYQAARNLDEQLRIKIINAKRRELQLNGFTAQQANEWYPDTWGLQGEHYPHLHPGTWTITRLADMDERGQPVYEPISHDNISWRAESEFAAKKAAQAYLQAHPGEQLRVRQDTVTMPGSGITDRTRLRDLASNIRDATTRIVDGNASPDEVLKQLYDQSAAAAYGPRNAAKRQFGPALQRETNLQGWTKDIEDFRNYLMAGERYVQLAPARQILMKARNAIAQLAGMPQVQKIGDFPPSSRYFNASQYGNILARVDNSIEGLEGHPGMWDAGMRYFAGGMGFDPDIIAKAFRPVQQVTALLKLGFQPARVLSHGLQTLWAVYPVLGEKATLQGIAHSFDPAYNGLIHDLAVTHSGNMSDVEGLREYAGAYFGHGSTPIDWTKGTAHIIRDLGLMPFTMGIDFTRRVAAVGAYTQGLERDLGEVGARNYARDVMDRTTGIYNAADNSALLRQLPGPVSQFKGFMLKTLQFMTNLRGPEIARFGAAISLMGVVGFPAIRALSNLTEQATGDNPENYLKRKFPIASRGAFGALGLDQPASVGFADWFASRPGIPLGGAAGPAGSDILNFSKALIEKGRGPSREAKQDLDTAIRQLSPEARRIWDEAIRGASTTPSLIDPRTGSTIIKQLTPLERAESLIGFTPLKVAQERESHEYIRNQLAQAKDQRGFFIDKLAENQLELMRPNLTTSQKADLIKETVSLQKLAVEYNQAKGIVPAVRERIREMLMDRLTRDLKKAPKPERPMIYNEQQRFNQEQ